jgi:hypothetical protein
MENIPDAKRSAELSAACKLTAYCPWVISCTLTRTNLCALSHTLLTGLLCAYNNGGGSNAKRCVNQFTCCNLAD